jgi:hypothetical protein
MKNQENNMASAKGFVIKKIRRETIASTSRIYRNKDTTEILGRNDMIPVENTEDR